MTALGTERTRLRFALLPTRMADGSLVWLRPYRVLQRRVQRTLLENARWMAVGRIQVRLSGD